MFRSLVRRGMASVLVVALGFSYTAFVAPAANAADPIPTLPTVAAAAAP